MKHEARIMNKGRGQAPKSRSAPYKAKFLRGSATSGQVMLLTVMMLTGVILSTTSLVALITLYQIRQTGDITASTQAIFAADAGLECALYVKRGGTSKDWGNCSQGRLSNGAEFKTVSEPGTIKSAGKSRRSARAFEVSF